MKQAQPTLEQLLADVPRGQPTRKNVVAENVPLANAIQEFLTLKAAEDDRVSGVTLAWFFEHKLRPAFGGPVWFGTVRSYVRNFLGVCHRTGRKL